MTLAQVAGTLPKSVSAYRLVVIEKLTAREAARRLDVKQNAIYSLVRNVKIALGEHRPVKVHAQEAKLRRVERRLTKLGRCSRCSLLLPCVCLPGSAAEIADRRTGAGDVYPEGLA